ncbi:MAG: hypothetical protein IJF63_01280 [Alistipes sp.]|nr:hypothetical protein [Alistipes sp.]
MKKFLLAIVVAMFVAVACDTPNEGKEPTVGSGTITYNTSTAEVVGAFCQSDEDTVVLYFTPSDVKFDALDAAQYYLKITLEASLLNGKSLDVGKGEAVVELFDIEKENELKATNGTVSISGAVKSASFDISLEVTLDDGRSVAALSFNGGCISSGAVEYANEWTYLHNKVGALNSIIWGAFIDSREVNMWHIYLAPVKDITFEEVSYFSPVKITIPVDFPLDGSKHLFSESADISVTYGSEVWNSANAPQGSIRAEYNAKRGNFKIRFTTDGKLKGYYSGPITVVE